METQDPMALAMGRYQSQKDEVAQLHARVAQLERDLQAARMHSAECICSCPGRLAPAHAPAQDDDVHMSSGSDASAAHAAFGGAASGSQSAGGGSISRSASTLSSQPSILNIIFGEHEVGRKQQAAAASSSPAAGAGVPKSPPRARMAAHHLSPPTSGGSARHRAPSSPQGSMSEAERLIAQMDDDAVTVAAAASPSRLGVSAPSTPTTSGKKRPRSDLADAAAHGPDEETLAHKTAKFIRVTSPGGALGGTETPTRVPALPLAIREDEDDAAMGVMGDMGQPSQDAYDQEEEASAAAPGGGAGVESPEYDYADRTLSPRSARSGASASTVAAESAADAKRARWTALVAQVHPAALETAKGKANMAKERGNREFTGSHLPQALDLYSLSIRTLEAALRGVDLQPWIQLDCDENEAKAAAHSGLGSTRAAAIAAELDLLDSVVVNAASTGLLGLPAGTSGASLYAQVKTCLHLLSSVYANRATCHAKSGALFAALGDVHHVLSLQPTWFKGHSIRGSILGQQRQYEEAARAFETALKMPTITEADATKLRERLSQLKKQAARAESATKRRADGGSESHSSQTSLTSSVAAPSRAAAPTRAQSTSALTTTSAGAYSSKMGSSAAQPIEVPSSASLPLHASHASSPHAMFDVPVHPPSFVTPPGSQLGGRQPSPLEQKPDSMDLLLVRADTPPHASSAAVAAASAAAAAAAAQRKQEEDRIASDARTAVRSGVLVMKTEPQRARSPLPALTPVSSAALLAPLNDASNRANPVPRSPASAAAAAAPAGVRSPARGPQRSPVHDLTVSPRKPRRIAGGPGDAAAVAPPSSGRSRRSPSKSPARSPARSPAHPAGQGVNWAVLPLVTIEGVRDLIGDETFAEALDMLDKRRLESIKLQPVEGASQPRLCGLMLKRDATRSRRTPPTAAGGGGPEKENNTLTVSVKFDEAGEQKVKEFSCDCREELQRDGGDHHHGPAAAAAGGGASMISPPPVVHKTWTPCAHVGTLLLVLKNKQEQQEKLKPLEWTASERAQRSMYVTPSRRKTPTEMKKEAAVRAQLEDLSNSALSEQLSRNSQSKTGSKAVLIARIVENSLLGNLPRCKQCRGSLFYASGGYRCHGGYDPVARRVIQCDFFADRIERSVWQG